jgi:hypothetical protein
VVYLPPRLVSLAQELMEKYPTGPLFRDQNGEPFTKASVCGPIKSLWLSGNKQEGKEAVRPEVTAYS